ncbi:ribosome biogenesis-related protein, putative [Cryptococcus deneoformans JEC21]|uniref:Ribosome biogenesis-related protein, putative n=1 Tax=Cryptococcus deneoformans (strain JEC21 / ATCC MYA-565) TaxID=214684 RepID=Q5KBQ8_CRYD1|nr:ribosome biogenesis-related protein, putative [Cryptococcus neoformans var. neoformans JEC21]AAW45496.1 ribosome biogenesis-related protein, putative [Cryptococcus neoformans var. neoformans JEC21]
MQAQVPKSDKSSSSSGSEEDYSSDYSSSSEDVTEDEEGNELTPALDAAILRTLSKIKKKEGVYGGENVLQEELRKAQEIAEQRGLKSNIVKKVAEKPYLLADYHRSKLLAGEDQDEDSESAEPLTHVESQRRLRQEAVSAFKTLAEESDDESDEEFIQKREMDAQEVDEDDEEYKKFLLEFGGGEEEVRKILGMGDQPAILKVLESEGGEDEEEKAAVSKIEKEELERQKQEKEAKKAKDDDDFLMNYILNRGWIDRSEKHVPTYDEVVGPSTEVAEEAAAQTKSTKPKSSHPWGELDEESDFEDRAEEFETEYNFRFEEPGSSTIATHPRDIPSLVRRADDTRKSKRARRAERKAAEKAAKEEEIKREKGKKRREMEKRMNILKHDLEKEGFKDLEWGKLEKVLDGEWDENVWEKIVGGMLSKGDEQEDGDDNEKPTWDDELGDAEYDEEEGEGDFQYEFAEGEGEGEDMDVDEDEGPINMDADFIDEEPSKKSKKKDKKKKNKNKEHSPSPLPEDEENQLSIPEKAHALKEAVESYNALAHEDIIEDMPTRFKYTPSAPASFGLTPVEILLATDDELNKLVTMKGIAPYRKGGIGIQGKGLGKRVRELKDKLRERRWGEEPSQTKSREEKKEKKRKRDDGEERGQDERRGKKSEGEATEKSEKVRNGKRLGKKERMRLQKAAEAAGAAPAAAGEPESAPAEKKRTVESGEMPADAPAANGEDGGDKKKRRKKKKSKADGEA